MKLLGFLLDVINMFIENMYINLLETVACILLKVVDYVLFKETLFACIHLHIYMHVRVLVMGQLCLGYSSYISTLNLAELLWSKQISLISCICKSIT